MGADTVELVGDEMWQRGYVPPVPPEDEGDATLVELDDVAPPAGERSADGAATPDPVASDTDAFNAGDRDGTERGHDHEADVEEVAVRSRRRWWIALAVVALIGSAAGAVTFWPQSDGSSAGDVVVPQKTDLVEIWSTEFDGRVDEVRIADGGVFVMSALDGLVIRYDLATGDEEWRATIGDARDPGVFEIVDDLVVVGTRLRSNRGQANIGRVHVLDRDDGREVWREANTGAIYGLFDGSVPRIVSGRTGQTLQLLDLETGIPYGEVAALGGRGESSGGVIVSSLDGNARVLAVEDGEPVRPTFSQGDLTDFIGLGDEVLAFGPSGVLVRVATDGALEPLGPDRIDTSGAEADADTLDDRSFVAVGDGSARFEFDGDTIESTWRVDGRLGPPIATVVGQAAIARLSDSVGPTTYGLVDLSDGAILWQTEPGTRRIDAPTLLADGVLLPPRIGESQSLSALDIAGNELWALDLPSTLTATSVGQGFVAVASRIGATSSVTVHG